MYRFRFIRVILQCFIQKPIALLDTFELNFIAIPLLDTDIERLFTQTYAQLMGLARWHFLFHSEFRNVAFKKKWVPVTTADKIAYKRSVKAFDRIQLMTKMLYWDDRRFYLEQVFYVKGQPHVRCLVEGMVRGPKGHLKNPVEVFKEIGVLQNSPPITSEIQNFIQSLS